MDIIIRDGQPLTQDTNGGMHRSSVAELVAEIQQLRTRIEELHATDRQKTSEINTLVAENRQLHGVVKSAMPKP